MQLRRSFIFGVAFSLATFCSFDSNAQQAALPENAMYMDMRWEVLSQDEKLIIDRLAADFFENSLRYSQASAIETHTAELYAAAPEDARARFRRERRRQWLAMSEEQRRALRESRRPQFDHLAETQKQPFRRYAFDRLDAAGAVDHGALNAALRNDI